MKKKRAIPEKTKRKHRVLIVDDHVMVREGVAEIVKNQPDLDVCGMASNAIEAADAISRLTPDLVLLDITMPGKSGVEFIKDARALQPDLRILVMSMHEETLYADRVLRAGGRGYIRKQEGGEKLVAAIRKVLRGEIAVSEAMTGKLLETFSGRKKMDSPLAQLSDRELEVFRLIGEGKTMKQIGDQLHLSPKTIEVHRSNIREKLGITNAAELISFAARWAETQA